MKKLKLLALVGFIAIANSVNSQVAAGGAPMCALNSGDISSLANVKTVNIVYDYSDLGVGAFRKEEDYLKKKCDDLEAKGKSADCKKFREDWVAARAKHYEPKFETMWKKYGVKEAMMDGSNNTAAEYTLTIHTIFIEPGVNAGIYKKPSYIDMECTFTDKSGKVLCMFYIKNAVGSQATGYDFAVESRLVESYAKAAKMLAVAIKKERKKKK
ncbi:MAG TPA: hypothetical protein VJI69_07190 [Bacteroidia bacterium]|nr:hypothetical protein [Bacteroidia bacterium]